MSVTDPPELSPEYVARLRLEKQRDDAMQDRIEEKLKSTRAALKKRTTVRVEPLPLTSQEEWTGEELRELGIIHVDLTRDDTSITMSMPIGGVELVRFHSVASDGEAYGTVTSSGVDWTGKIRMKHMPTEPLPTSRKVTDPEVAPKGVPVFINCTHSVSDEDGVDVDGADEELNPKDLAGSRKPSLALFPPAALIMASKAMKDGAIEYGPYNWREKKIGALEYISATKRHLDSWIDGEELSRDRKTHHLAAALATLAILIDAMTCGCLKDDRPPPGAAADLIEQLTVPKEPDTP